MDKSTSTSALSSSEEVNGLKLQIKNLQCQVSSLLKQRDAVNAGIEQRQKKEQVKKK